MVYRLILMISACFLASLSVHVAQAYEGRQLDAVWRRDAADRISQHRRGPLVVIVRDAEGRPVPRTEVHVEQTRHAFGFGASISSVLYQEDSEAGAIYRRLIDQVFRFNEIVTGNDLKPYHYVLHRAGVGGHHAWDAVEQTLSSMKDRRVRVRGHYLLHGMIRYRQGKTNYLEAYEADAPRLRELLLAEAILRGQAVGSLVDEWDVVNHTAGYNPQESWVGRTQDPAYAAQDIRVLDRALPADIQLYLNEGNILANGGSAANRYDRVVRGHLEAGAPIDGIGFMGHFKADEATFDSGKLTPPRRQFEILERFAAHGKALKLTEFDVDTGADEQMQADFLRDTMTIAFSHPAMEGVVMWGFWEGRHWRKPAALVRLDGTLKPSGRAWLDLVYGRWWTDVKVSVDGQGGISIPAYYGRYRITVPGLAEPIEVSHTQDAPAKVIVSLP